MGGEYFEDYGEGTDADAIFKTLVDTAFYDFGHAGYSGSICEKPGYDLVSDVPVPKRNMSHWAEDYEEENNNAKWDNAFAVPVCEDEKHQEIIGYLFFGVASS